MKILQISSDIERHLVSICDAALKGMGMGIHDSVQAVKAAVSVLEDKKE